MVPLQQHRSLSGLTCKVAQAWLDFVIDFSLSSIFPWHEPSADKFGVNSLAVYFTYFGYLVQLKWPNLTFPNKNETKHFSTTEFHIRGWWCLVCSLEVLVAGSQAASSLWAGAEAEVQASLLHPLPCLHSLEPAHKCCQSPEFAGHLSSCSCEKQVFLFGVTPTIVILFCVPDTGVSISCYLWQSLE